MKFSTIKNGLLATAAASVMAMSVTGPAKADAIAFAGMVVSSAMVSVGGTQLDVSDFDSVGVLNTATSGATLTGFPDANAAAGPVPAPISMPMSCLGACLDAYEDLYTAPGGGGTSFSRGDADLAGALITGLPAPSTVTARVVADSQVSGEKAATAGGTTGTNSSFNFTLAAAGAVTISFDADIWLIADLTTETGIGAFAAANANFTISIVDTSTGAQVFTWTPDGLPGGIGGTLGGVEGSDPYDLNNNLSQVIPGGSVSFIHTGGTFSATTAVLSDAVTYTLNINQGVGSSAISVPEPGTLGLLGAGLVALGVTRRRKANKAA